MPALKEGEVLTPLRGLCDTVVRGEGLIDMCSYEKDGEIRTGFQGEYIDLTLSFAYGEDEEEYDSEEKYAEIKFSNRLSSLRPLRGEDLINLKTGEISPPEGVIELNAPPTKLEEKIILCSELLIEILIEKIRRGGKYGGERSYQLFNIKNS